MLIFAFNEITESQKGWSVDFYKVGLIDESIYLKKHPNPQQIATKGFWTVFGSIRYKE